MSSPGTSGYGDQGAVLPRIYGRRISSYPTEPDKITGLSTRIADQLAHFPANGLLYFSMQLSIDGVLPVALAEGSGRETLMNFELDGFGWRMVPLPTKALQATMAV